MSTRASNWSGNWAHLRDIEVICAVIAERKTTGAALRLGISQPAVSRTIARIEARLGRPLFHREAGRLVPTAHALDLYKRSNRVFDALGELDAMSQPADRPVLSILAPPTMCLLFLEREAAAFAKRHPDLLLSVDIITMQELPGAIAERRADLGMLDSDVTHPGVVLEPYLETAAFCILPEDHRLARQERITAADLDGVAYVGVKRRHTLRNALDRIFAEWKAEPKIVIETNAALAAADFVREGLGVSILNPFPLLLDKRQGLVSRPFDPPVRFRSTFVLPADGPPSEPARQFLDFLKERRGRVLAGLPSYE